VVAAVAAAAVAAVMRAVAVAERPLAWAGRSPLAAVPTCLAAADI